MAPLPSRPGASPRAPPPSSRSPPPAQAASYLPTRSRPLGRRPPIPLGRPCLLPRGAAHPARSLPRRASMPSVKPRGAKGGHGAANPSDKGSSQPSGGAGDVAKKPSPPALYLQQQQQPPPPRAHEQPMPPQPQQQAHGKGGHRGKAAANAAVSSEPCSRWRGHSVESFLFYLALVVATGLSGWYARRFLDEVQQVRRSHRDLNQQNDVLVQGLQGVEQKVGTRPPEALTSQAPWNLPSLLGHSPPWLCMSPPMFLCLPGVPRFYYK